MLFRSNEAHDSTGAQATVTANVDFAQVAAACGYQVTMGGTDIAMLDRLLDRDGVSTGPILGHLKIKTGTLPDLPRPAVTPEQVARRLMAHIGTKL